MSLLPVAQVQVAVIVEVADVADGEHVARPRAPGLLRVPVVLEGGVAHLQVDLAGLAGRHLVAVRRRGP